MSFLFADLRPADQESHHEDHDRSNRVEHPVDGIESVHLGDKDHEGDVMSEENAGKERLPYHLLVTPVCPASIRSGIRPSRMAPPAPPPVGTADSLTDQIQE